MEGVTPYEKVGILNSSEGQNTLHNAHLIYYIACTLALTIIEKNTLM